MNETNTIEEYILKKDWRINENANRIYSVGGLKTHIAEKAIARYALKKYPKEIAEAYKNAFFHIHDLAHNCSYCAGWSIQDLLLMGFGGVSGTVYSSPAKHFSSALGQLMNFLGVVQQEWAGAQAINSFDTLLAPFIRHDKLSLKEVKQCLQEFVYNLNVTLRFAHETPFTNISFDLTIPDDLVSQPVVIGRRVLDETYADYQKEADMINQAFLEVMYGGDAHSGIFRFPIPTYSITPEFEWENGVGKWISKVTAKFGLPYFENMIGTGKKQHDTRSMCCHLQLDLNELKGKTGGLFGYNDKTGSIGVVTLNLSRIAFLSKDENRFFDILSYYLNLAKNSLEIKREIVEKNLENGLFPYTKVYLPSLKHHFSTIGVIAGEEACQNLLHCSIVDKEGQKFIIKTLKYIRERLKEFQKETANLYNLEATPAEGASYRLARIDRNTLKGIVTSGTKTNPYYTNSTQLPVGYTEDLFEAIELQEELQSLYTGGTVFHGFIGERVPEEAVQIYVNTMCKTKIPYFTMTPSFSICRNCGYLPGEISFCPKCGKETEIYSRVVGYYSPVRSWNIGKGQEFKERRSFRKGI